MQIHTLVIGSTEIPSQNDTLCAQFVKNAKESDIFWGGSRCEADEVYVSIDRGVILDYVKIDAARFCRHARDSSTHKKR